MERGRYAENRGEERMNQTKCKILHRKLSRAKQMKERCERASLLSMIAVPILLVVSIALPILLVLVVLALIGIAINSQKARVYESECDDIRLQIADCHTGHHK